MLEVAQSVLLFGVLTCLSLLVGFCVLLITAAALDELSRWMRRRRPQQTIHSPGRGRESGMENDRLVLKKTEAITESLKAHRKELRGLLTKPMSEEALRVVENLEDSIDSAVGDGVVGVRHLWRTIGDRERG